MEIKVENTIISDMSSFVGLYDFVFITHYYPASVQS